MLDFQVLRICQVFNIKVFLNLLDTVQSQVDNLILLIDNEISGLLNLLAHDGGQLRELGRRLALLQLLCQNVADFVELRGLSALSGDDQRCSGLIDQDRVHLVDDGVIQIS